MTYGLGPSAQLQAGAGQVLQQDKSLLSRINPVVRLSLGGVFAIFILTLSSLTSLAICFVLSISLTLCSRLPLFINLKRTVLMESFLIFTVILLPFTQPGAEITIILGLSVSEEGCFLAMRLLLIANASTLMVLTLVGTIEPAFIGRTLASLGCPTRFVFLIDFSVRYIGLLQDEYLRGREAMRARGFQILDMSQGRNWSFWKCDIRQLYYHQYQSMGYLFAMSLVRGIERAQVIHEAMRCRGYQDVCRFRYLIQFHRWDWGCLIGSIVILGVIKGFDILW